MQKSGSRFELRLKSWVGLAQERKKKREGGILGYREEKDIKDIERETVSLAEEVKALV